MEVGPLSLFLLLAIGKLINEIYFQSEEIWCNITNHFLLALWRLVARLRYSIVSSHILLRTENCKTKLISLGLVGAGPVRRLISIKPGNPTCWFDCRQISRYDDDVLPACSHVETHTGITGQRSARLTQVCTPHHTTPYHTTARTIKYFPHLKLKYFHH